MLDEVNAAAKLISSYLKPLLQHTNNNNNDDDGNHEAKSEEENVDVDGTKVRRTQQQENNVESPLCAEADGSQLTANTTTAGCSDCNDINSSSSYNRKISCNATTNNDHDDDNIDCNSDNVPYTYCDNCCEISLTNLREAISVALQAKFEGHWYPSLPSKGSGYRCLKFGAQYGVDGAIVSACESFAINKADIVNYIPNDLILWIDPCEVSYKIGESVPLTTVYSKPREEIKTSDPDFQTHRKVSKAAEGRLSSMSNSSNNSPIMSQQQYSYSSSVQDPNNNDIDHPLSGMLINNGAHVIPSYCNSSSTSAKKYSLGSAASGATDSDSSSSSAVVNFGKSPTSKISNVTSNRSPVNSHVTVPSTTISPPAFAKHSAVNTAAAAATAVSSHVLVTANEFLPPVAPPPLINNVALHQQQQQNSSESSTMGATATELYNIHMAFNSRPTTLPGVKNAGCFSAPINNAVGGRPSVSRNLGGYYWKSNNRQQSASFSALNPEAAVFSPSDSPEQQMFGGTGGVINGSFPSSSYLGYLGNQSNNRHSNGHFNMDHFVGGGTGIGIGASGSSFSDDSHIHSNITSSSSSNVNPFNVNVANMASTHGSGSGGADSEQLFRQRNNPTINSLISPTQQFHTSNGLMQLQQQFQQQNFRGGSPVDYGVYNRSSPLKSSVAANAGGGGNVGGSGGSSSAVNASVGVSSLNGNGPNIANGTSLAASSKNNVGVVGGGGFSGSINSGGGGSGTVANVVGGSGGSNCGGSANGGGGAGAGVGGGVGGVIGGNNQSVNSLSATSLSPSNSVTSCSKGGSNNGNKTLSGQVTSSGSNGVTNGSNGTMTGPMTATAVTVTGAPDQQRSANQQLMTADAFAATKFGSTKLKSRKSNINLSQMSPTQFEAYMRHKTSTMHSRPPHTNYTDAYPSSNANYNMSSPSNTGAAPIHHSNQHPNMPPPPLPTNANSAAAFYGPISPVGRGSSAGSSNSTPSPCGSYPGFPSPSMADLIASQGNGLSRNVMPMGTGMGGGSQRYCAMTNNTNSNSLNSTLSFDQIVHDLCDDPFFQQPGLNGGGAAPFLSANYLNSNIQPTVSHSGGSGGNSGSSLYSFCHSFSNESSSALNNNSFGWSNAFPLSRNSSNLSGAGLGGGNSIGTMNSTSSVGGPSNSGGGGGGVTVSSNNNSSNFMSPFTNLTANTVGAN